MVPGVQRLLPRGEGGGGRNPGCLCARMREQVRGGPGKPASASLEGQSLNQSPAPRVLFTSGSQEQGRRVVSRSAQGQARQADGSTDSRGMEGGEIGGHHLWAEWETVLGLSWHGAPPATVPGGPLTWLRVP